MVAPIETEFGHSCPPEGPHTITFHVPGWELIRKVRDGDMSPMARLTSIYPRFGPFGNTRELTGRIHKALGLPPTHGILPFLDPGVFQLATEFIASPHRKDEHRFVDGDLTFRVVDIKGANLRLYVLVFPGAKFPGINGIWQDPGLIITTRHAETVLPHTDSITEVPFDGNLSAIPAPTFLPESDAHGKIRSRISSLLHRAAINPSTPQPAPEDITLYSTGMGAVYRLTQALTAYRPVGQVLALGALFHNTWHLFEETPAGAKHFGEVATAAGLDAVEAWLEGKDSKDGTKPDVSFAFFEFPSNPIAVSLDLSRLRALADKYGFPLVSDDTVGSFANLDFAGAADVLMSSLTKSFSGYADVMGGSVALYPGSTHYAALSKLVRERFQNELFSGDAETLLGNSEDYLERSEVLDSNATQLASFLDSQTTAKRPESALIGVLHPSTVATRANYDKFMRQKTAEHTPGYGCLLNLEFDEFDAAYAFYEDLKLHIGPHLGAHRTLALAFNDMSYGRYADKAAYHRAYGIRGESVRISVGLEDFGAILGPVKEGLERADKAKAERKKE